MVPLMLETLKPPSPKSSFRELPLLGACGSFASEVDPLEDPVRCHFLGFRVLGFRV